jgi:flagellar basal body-associated protein FliL
MKIRDLEASEAERSGPSHWISLAAVMFIIACAIATISLGIAEVFMIMVR